MTAGLISSPNVFIMAGGFRFPIACPTLSFVPVRQAGRVWPSTWFCGGKNKSSLAFGSEIFK